jgi:hypothetical protein
MPDQKPASSPEIDALLKEDRRFEPSAAFRAAATVNDPGVYERAAKDPEAFWAGFARELDWMTPWSTVLEWTPPYAASTASTATPAGRAATRPRWSGKASPATAAP